MSFSYKDLGYNSFGIKSIPTYISMTPEQTRASAQPGAVIADGVHVSSGGLKVDKDGIYLGTSVPTYEEGRIYYSFTEHALKVGGKSAWEVVTSV